MYLTQILLLSVAAVTANLWDGPNLCGVASNCECVQDQKYFHLYCPDMDRNVRISIRKDTLFATVKCDTSAELHFQKLPRLDIDEIRGIEFVNCSIPANGSFGSILQRFGIRPLLLVADNMGHSLLQQQFFRGCEYLRALAIRNNRNRKTKLNETVFEKLPSLHDLDLSDNKITFLEKDVFKSLGKLLTLKLSNNKLGWLPEELFLQQNKLVSLYLDNNQLEFLTKATFTGLSSLSYLSLKKNNYKRLTQDVFQNIPNLTFIALGNINTKYKIPDNIFATNKYLDTVYLERVIISNGLNLRSISTLSIEESEFENFSNNSLTNIIVQSISGSRDMTDLILSRNQLTDLYDGLFDGFKQLSSLLLSYNNLSTISGLVFQDLQKLKELHLAHNHLQTIHPEAFTNTKYLKLIDLSNNQLFFKDNRAPFKYLVNLVTLNLGNNNLTAIPSDLINIKELSRLNLASNNISSFKYMEFSYKLPNLEIHYEPEVKNNLTDLTFATNFLHVYLNDNFMECDCSMYEFLHQKNILRYQLLQAIAYSCKKPMTSKRLLHRRCYSNSTHLPFKCPDKCECLINLTIKSNQRISIDCKDRGLAIVPEIPSIENQTYTLELYVHNNSLKELPKLQSNLHVTIIQASYNSIYEIREENLPPNLRALDVSHNNIKTISPNVYEALKSHRKLEIVFLADNPWLCDCTEDTRALIKFVAENISLTDLQDAICRVGLISSGTYTLSSGNVALLDDLCVQITVSIVAIALAALVIVIAILGILFYKYQQLLKVWLYAHHACLWFFDEEELDKDKKYDAFISYSHLDGDLAVKVVSELENGDPHFKICLHERGRLQDKLIAEWIMESIEDSRRTIVILSKNYLKSVWGRHELHCVFPTSLKEKRNRIIIITYGDIEKVDKLDSEIESYLMTHTYTYIKWGETFFWKKLRYALQYRN